jgi:hypothetical protein
VSAPTAEEIAFDRLAEAVCALTNSLEFEWEGDFKAEIVALNQAFMRFDITQRRITRAAVALLNAVDARQDNCAPPLKYTIPYGAVNDLRAAVNADQSKDTHDH